MHKGKVVLIGFFATWCRGCVAELPRVEREISQKYKDSELAVIEVGRGHTWNELARFKRNSGLNLVMVEDPRREIYNKYATEYIPRCYLIGKDGRVKFAFTGNEESDFVELKRHIEEEVKVEIPKAAEVRPQDFKSPEAIDTKKN